MAQSIGLACWRKHSSNIFPTPSPAADLGTLPRPVCSFQLHKPSAISPLWHTHARTSLASSLLLGETPYSTTDTKSVISVPSGLTLTQELTRYGVHSKAEKKALVPSISPFHLCQGQKMVACSTINFAFSFWVLLKNPSNASNARNVSFSWF